MAKTSLSALVQKLQKHLNAPRPRLEKKVMIGDLGEEFVLQSLTEDELDSALNYSDDPKEQNKYVVYSGCPKLREAAEDMLKKEIISDPVEVMNSFKYSDVDEMAQIVANLTLEYKKPTVKEVTELKN